MIIILQNNCEATALWTQLGAHNLGLTTWDTQLGIQNLRFKTYDSKFVIQFGKWRRSFLGAISGLL